MADAVDPLIAAIVIAAAGTGVTVNRALRVEDGRYFTYGEDGPAEGIPFTVTRPEGVLARRDDLVEQLAPACGAAATRMARAVARAEAADPGREARLAVVASAIARYRDGGHLAAGHDETARLLAALRHLRFRDDAWVSHGPGAQGRAPAPVDRPDPARTGLANVAAPASLLAWVAWQAGDGALANIALDRADADNPTYSSPHGSAAPPADHRRVAAVIGDAADDPGGSGRQLRRRRPI